MHNSWPWFHCCLKCCRCCGSLHFWFCMIFVCASQQQLKKKNWLWFYVFVFVWTNWTHLQQLNNFGMSFFFREIKWRFAKLLIVFLIFCLVVSGLFLPKKNKFWFFLFLIGICYKYKNHIKTVHKFDTILTINSWIYLEILVFGWNSHHIGQHTHTHTMFILFPTTTIELRK